MNVLKMNVLKMNVLKILLSKFAARLPRRRACPLPEHPAPRR
jgi:hypothetical protein